MLQAVAGRAAVQLASYQLAADAARVESPASYNEPASSISLRIQQNDTDLTFGPPPERLKLECSWCKRSRPPEQMTYCDEPWHFPMVYCRSGVCRCNWCGGGAQCQHPTTAAEASDDHEAPLLTAPHLRARQRDTARF